MNSPQPTPHGAPHSPSQPGFASKVVAPQAAPPNAMDLEPIGLVDEDEPLLTVARAVGATEPAPHASKIRVHAADIGHLHSDAKYARKPNADGRGACRLRTFHGRLSDEGLAFMDDKINQWLDGHPEIEIKFVTSTVGLYEGKIKEPALIMCVWY